MPWLKITLRADPARAEAVADALTECGAIAVSIEDGRAPSGCCNLPLLESGDATAELWTQSMISGLFPADTRAGGIVNVVNQRLGASPVTEYETAQLPDQDWERAWMERYRPIRVGEKLWVCPSWCTPLDPEAVNIFMDPGLAFGTGTHPSTAMCLEWLAAHPPAGGRVVDYGCGSGILAIAALKLGAERAWGVDMDTRALAVSLESAARNGVGPRYLALTPEAIPSGLQADVVLANILAEPLIALAPVLAALVRPGGTSGPGRYAGGTAGRGRQAL